MSETSERVYALRKEVRPDPNQPRTEFPQEELIELSENISAIGIQEDLLVRLDPQKKVKYMLVDGERRWRAAELAKIERIPIRVREMSDMEARQYQRVSGTQRQNLSALEQAADFAKELAARQAKDAKFSPELLGKEWGLKRSTVYNRLRLTKLNGPAREALVSGKIDVSRALLIATVAPAAQAKLLKEATAGSNYDDQMSVRQLQEYIQDEYQHTLKGAPFKLDDATLLNNAGPCITCPKRSGNIAGFDGDPNVCTDLTCFEQKRKLSGAAELRKAAEAGKKILPPSDYENNSYKFLRSDQTCHRDSKDRNFGTLAKTAKIEPMVTLDDETGQRIEVFSRADESKILAANKIRSSYSNGGGDDSRKRQKKKKENTPIVWAATQQVLSALVTDAGIAEKAWRLIADGVAAWINIEVEANIAKRRGLAEKMGEVRDALEGWLTGSRTTRELQEFVVEALTCASWDEWGGTINADFKATCKIAGVNLDKIKAATKEWDEMGHTDHGETIASANELTPEVKKIIESIEAEHINILREALKKPGGLAPGVWKAVTARLAKLTKQKEEINHRGTETQRKAFYDSFEERGAGAGPAH